MLLRILKLSIFYTAITWIVLIFAIHGVQGVLGAQTPITIVTVLGFSTQITQLLVTLAGLLDLLVVVAVLLFPHKWVLIWTGAWPWIPYIMALYSPLLATPIEAILTAIAASLALFTRPDTTILEAVSKKLKLPHYFRRKR